MQLSLPPQPQTLSQRLMGAVEALARPVLRPLKRSIETLGSFLLLCRQLVVQREKFAVYWEATMREAVSMGVGSVLIVVIISVFVGAVSTVQTAYQLFDGLIPKSAIGNIVSASAILEFAPTITSLVLAGKIGSSIASQLGTMRVSEQIDALEVMGINSASFLILPKIIGAALVFPLLVIIAAFLIHVGGIFAGDLQGLVTSYEFAEGARGAYEGYQVFFMLVKSVTFGLLISAIGSFQGYRVSGGALEVGEASTRAVVQSCIAVLIADFLLANYLL